MKRYLLSVIQPEGDPPPQDILEPIMRNVRALNEEMAATGVLVFSGGLHPPAAASVVRPSDGRMLVTDGPYIEAKEHIGGFLIIEARDLDVALEWAHKAARATTLPIEVRPFQ